MIAQVANRTRPRSVLLATDLSARCDRALDRAGMLALAWNAELIVVHALEQAQSFYDADLERRLPSWRRSHDAKRIAENQLRHDMLQTAVPLTVVVEPAQPAELILRTAADYARDIIVTGIARDELLGRFGLGTTVTRLLRGSGAPVLIAKARARSSYGNIIVATDFSDASEHALRVALDFFPDDRLTVFHAYQAPTGRLSGDPARVTEAFADLAHADFAAFLQSVEMSDERREHLGRLVEPGHPSELIARYVEDQGVDLVVLGTRGRNALMQMFLGSTAQEILWSLSCDTLVVRGSHATLPA